MKYIAEYEEFIDDFYLYDKNSIYEDMIPQSDKKPNIAPNKPRDLHENPKKQRLAKFKAHMSKIKNVAGSKIKSGAIKTKNKIKSGVTQIARDFADPDQ